MSDSGEKKHPASAKKLRDQRKKGQVSQSQDIGKLLALTAISEIALFTAETSLQRFQQLMRLPLSSMAQPFTRALEEVLFEGLTVFFSFALLMVATAILMKLISSWMQFGLLFAPETLKLDFNRLNPLKQLKQMFSAQSVMNLLMSIAKALLLGMVVYLVIRPSLGTLINLASSDLQTYILALIALFRYLLHACLALLLVLALIDLVLQKHFFAKRMRMTQVEVVKEYKDMEGDPHVKGKRRALAQELAQEEPKVKLPKLEESDMLVVNPTHFAVPTDAIIQLLGSLVICRAISAPMLLTPLRPSGATRVMIMPAVREISRAGICAIRPSPMVSTEYSCIDSAALNPC